MRQRTVFISPGFMTDVMKGLIRHDRDSLLSFFRKTNNNLMKRRVKRFSFYGRLHEDLVPFLWPSTDESRFVFVMHVHKYPCAHTHACIWMGL